MMPSKGGNSSSSSDTGNVYMMTISSSLQIAVAVIDMGYCADLTLNDTERHGGRRAPPLHAALHAAQEELAQLHTQRASAAAKLEGTLRAGREALAGQHAQGVH